jgi:hypothetical protein
MPKHTPHINTKILTIKYHIKLIIYIKKKKMNGLICYKNINE